MNKFLLLRGRKRSTLPCILFFLLIIAESIHSGDIATSYPECIILNMTAQPGTSQAVTWRTQASIITPRAQIVPAKASPDLDKGAVRVPAITDSVTIAGKTIYYHAVLFDTLTSNTVYAYRVGDESVWRECSAWTASGELFDTFELRK